MNALMVLDVCSYTIAYTIVAYTIEVMIWYFRLTLYQHITNTYEDEYTSAHGAVK